MVRMSSVHDFIIKKYSIDFETKQIIFDIYNESVEKQIIFHNFFAYKFYDEMPYSIILDLQEGSEESFFLIIKNYFQKEQTKGGQ